MEEWSIMSRKISIIAVLLAVLVLSVVSVTPAAAQSAVWNAQYYTNGILSGDAAVTRQEGAIAFNWGAGSPSGGIPNDGFSARFATDVVFPAGTYRFYTLADDDLRVTINFQPLPLINTFGQGRAGQTVSADVQLSGATHVQIDYVENTGNAYLYLSWANLATNPTGPNFAPPVSVPVNTAPWTAQYYANASLSGDPAAIISESAPGRDWGSGSPISSVPADNWSARWTSTQSLNAGTYQLGVSADDGVRVFVNGALLINQFGAATGQTYNVSVNLPQGNSNFIIEFSGNAFLNYTLQQQNVVQPTPIPVQGSAQIVGGAVMTVTGAFRLNVRALPDPINGAILVRINRNETYPIVGRSVDGLWWQINANGTVGWVSARFVTAQNAGAVPVVNPGQGGGAAPTPVPSNNANTGITVTASPFTVNVRQGPGTQFSRIAQLPVRQSAILVGRTANNQWFQINYNGITGWVTAQYVQVSSGANLTSVPVTG
jgi:uncharacterized protein YraI